MPCRKSSAGHFHGHFIVNSGDAEIVKQRAGQQAFASLKCKDHISRAYYDKKRAEGKKHNQAVIALARRRCNVLFAMLRDGSVYEAPEALTA